MFYFAFINENNVVTGVYAMPSDLSNITGYIAITEQQYNDSNAGNENSLIGKVYNPETGGFEVVPEWVCNATEVQYGEGTISVGDELDAINAILAEIDDGFSVDAYTKTESDAKYASAEHTHTGFANETHTHTAGEVVGVVTTINGTAPDENGNVTIAVSGGGMTAAEILTSVKTVDGADSGLDADTLDGMEASAFATADHTHTGYATTAEVEGKAAIDHTHTGYAEVDHTHSGYATIDHTHTGYATTSDLSGKADTNHTHNDYITASTYANGMNGKADTDHTHSGYASSSHTHTPASIGAAASSHTHSGYASSSHTHSGYFSTSGGTISGETNFSGGLVRVSGVQTLFHSGNQLVFGSNNLPTRIAGSAISATKTIVVDSDERLKENIAPVNVGEMVDFIKNLDVKSFNYIGNDEDCIGVIAQQAQEANPAVAKYLVSENEEGYLGVKAADIVFPLVVAVQELAKEVETLKGNN